MFIVVLTYHKELREVENYLEDHKQFLDKFYQRGNFITSGRQHPRIGGVILCKACNRQEVENIISQDPFYTNQIAGYQIIEFEPTKYCDEVLRDVFNYSL
ncbi:YciI family protein [uncultured Apibacter sp.]|uniref:YciI family protein n=1 Tax=uncultured Apibacter sp. TaxID=1778616 RepID=UPI0025D6F17D|nr:YciI family protein [uncultured Apibacter sp.]